MPTYYQYGVGSAGFGAWRELTSHIMATNWVISGKCISFPVLYHWRIVHCDTPKPMNTEQRERLERRVARWEGSSIVRNRVESMHNAPAYIVLFLEYIPQNLYQWLGAQLTAGENVKQTVAMIEGELKTTTDFMISQGFIHFDAHLENILTDGEQLYFSDFGLSLSKDFDLSSEETAFFDKHRTYDRCSAITSLLHCFMTYSLKKNQWKDAQLDEYLSGNRGELIPNVVPTINRYRPIALAMDDFYQSLIKGDKLTPYSKERLEELLREIDL